MRADVIVMMPPLFQQNLCFFQGIESLSVQVFIAQATIKALIVAVFPWTARLDIQGFDAQLLLHINYSLPPPLRAGQNFPVETSFKIRLSRLKSATTRFSRAFSCSRSFRRRA